MNTKSLVKIAKSLSDPHRLQLLQQIAQREQAKYCELLQCVPLSQPSMSQHLKALVEAGLIESGKVGRSLYLTINRAKLQELDDFLLSLKSS